MYEAHQMRRDSNHSHPASLRFLIKERRRRETGTGRKPGNLQLPEQAVVERGAAVPRNSQGANMPATGETGTNETGNKEAEKQGTEGGKINK